MTPTHNIIAAVIVPVYKSYGLHNFEISSFNQCCKILGRNRKYRIILATHTKVDLSIYKDIADRNGTNFQVEFFPSRYFKNIHGYNKLMCCGDFYKRFVTFNYLLICQLDAYIFRDELEYWCKKGYDYIGAPIFTPKHLFEEKYAFIGNGGGVSLRKVSSFIKVTAPAHPLTLSQIISIKRNHPYINWKKKILYILMLFFNGRCHQLRDFFSWWVNEDLFFSLCLRNTPFELCVPDVNEGARFAHDLHSEFWTKLIGGQKPFARHNINDSFKDSN